MRVKALLLAGILGTLTLGAGAETLSSHVVKTFPSKPGGRLEVDAAFQDVVVTIAPGDKVTVTVDLKISSWPAGAKGFMDAYAPVFTDRGKTIHVRSRAKNGFTIGILDLKGTIAVTMPPGMAIDLDTGSGDCRIKGDTGGAEVACDTGSGSVRLEGAVGTLVADTGSGDVVARLSAPARAVAVDTGSGDVDLVGPVADFKADTGSGGVVAKRLTGSAKIDTGSGDVKVSWSTAAEESTISIDTGSGSATLLFPASTKLGGRARTNSGVLSSTFEGKMDGRGRSVVYAGGPGSVRLDVSAGSGNVRISKKA